MSRLDDMANSLVAQIDSLPPPTLHKWYDKFSVYTRRRLATAIGNASESVISDLYGEFSLLRAASPSRFNRTEQKWRLAPGGLTLRDINDRVEEFTSMSGTVTVGIPYALRTRAPTTTDTNFDVPTMWINTTTGESWVLTEVSGGVASWSALTADAQVQHLQDQIDTKISSEPDATEYKIADIRLDADRHIVVKHEDTPES